MSTLKKSLVVGGSFAVGMVVADYLTHGAVKEALTSVKDAVCDKGSVVKEAVEDAAETVKDTVAEAAESM